MKNLQTKNHKTGRREFISMLSAAAVIGLTGIPGVTAASALYKTGKTDQQAPEMPAITLDPHRKSGIAL